MEVDNQNTDNQDELQKQKDFVTVVTVGNEIQQNVIDDKPFVTVLKIGDENKEIVEEVLVYRLPGERLGFGLKFEGGTKTSECVRRLFIQSCAPDSPASRVKSTWGSLIEGDEVLQIDAQPVKNMTRIDCVRSLKDSNVVIKLLVKHNAQTEVEDEQNVPHVVKAEKKRLPPPPPVPPRKVSRKKEGAIFVPPRAFADEEENTEKKLPSSPRVAARLVPPRIRDRRLSDGSTGPPDAEVYLDLLSQELDYGLKAESESDDTGSTISTVMDKHFSNMNSEKCSIASDSIPSTPNAIHKQLDLTKVLNPFEILEVEFESNNNQTDDLLLNKLAAQDIYEIKNKAIDLSQSPANFQDAHLSYGNEDVRSILRTDEWNDELKIKELNKINKENQTPKPTPRKCYAKKGQIEEKKIDKQEEVTILMEPELEKPILPRLVNFVPKTPTKDIENDFDTIKKDLQTTIENDEEKFETPSSEEENSYMCLDIVSLEKISDFRGTVDGCSKDEMHEFNNDDMEDEKYFIYKWSSSGQLATIGEDEEFEATEPVISRPSNTTPIVIVEKADEPIDEKCKIDTKSAFDYDEIDSTQTVNSTDDNQNANKDIALLISTELSANLESDNVPSMHATSLTTEEEQKVDKWTDDVETPSDSLEPESPSEGEQLENYEVFEKMDVATSKDSEPDSSSLNTPPPSSSRLPPDGHEFPLNYTEPQFERSYTMETENQKFQPPVPVKRTTLSPPKFVNPKTNIQEQEQTWLKTEERKVTVGSEGEKRNFRWRKDEKSSGSVRDKIAIFSSTNDSEPVFPQTLHVPIKLNKTYKSSDDIFSDLTKSNTPKSPVTKKELNLKPEISTSVSDITKYENWNTNFTYPDRSLSTIDLSSTNLYKIPETTKSRFSTLPKKQTEKNNNYVDDIASLKLRSQSMSDVAGSKLMRATSMVYQNPDTDSRRLALNTLIEQRRRSMSKLKGLVIPEKVVEVSSVIDLPEIRSTSLPSKSLKTENIECSTPVAQQRSSFSVNLSSPPWKTNDNSMKYSPAFKRKSLQIHETTEDSSKPPDNKVNYNSEYQILPETSKREVSYIETIISPTSSDYNYDFTNNLPENKKENKSEESDNDSAVSSSQSSYSKDYSSPPSSLQENYQKDSKIYSESSSPTSKNYDSLNRRILKAQSVEAINRKNILASAKCRSGQDLNSPLIQRKLEEDVKTNDASSNQFDSDYCQESCDNSLDFDIKLKEPKVKSTPPKPEVKTRPISLPNPLPTTRSTMEIKKNFEKNGYIPSPIRPIPKPTNSTNNNSTNGTNNNIKTGEPSRTDYSLRKNESMSSLKSSDFDSFNSSISSSSQELGLPDTSQHLEENGNVEVVLLNRETPGQSIGITLTGGTDYESKAITVHKVLNGSPAHKDGRLKKGVQIISINGKSMVGVTHKESVDILKAPSTEVTLVITRNEAPQKITPPQNGTSKVSPKSSPESSSQPSSLTMSKESTPTEKIAPIHVTLIKDKAGLGFSLDGGYDSPTGNKPLVIKKIFTGGAAEKCGELQAGDELVGVNNVDVNKMTRIEVWGMMKKLPEGGVLLRIRKMS